MSVSPHFSGEGKTGTSRQLWLNPGWEANVGLIRHVLPQAWPPEVSSRYRKSLLADSSSNAGTEVVGGFYEMPT